MKTKIPKMKHKFYDTIDFIIFLIGIVSAVLISEGSKKIRNYGKNKNKEIK